MPGADSASTAANANGTNLAVGAHTGGIPSATPSALPVRPNLPDDPVIPHNGFLTVEEGEKAFIHLLRKAGVDANWTWDQTMRAIITDPLYKALNTLAEKKACWEKVCCPFVWCLQIVSSLSRCSLAVYQRIESKRTRRTRSKAVEIASRSKEHAERQP